MPEESTHPVTRREVLVPGQHPREITEVRILSAVEPWCEYVLDDGTKMKVKMVVVGFDRVEGEYDPTGNPRYAMKASLVVHAEVPEGLKRKVQ